MDRLEGHDTRGRLVLRTEYRHWRAGAHGVGIHRGRFFGLLHDALGPAGVDLRCGTAIEAVRGPARPVLVDAAGGAHGPFDAAVIADGSGSRLRGQLRPNARAPVNRWRARSGSNGRPDPEGQFAGVLAQRYHRAEVMIGALPIGADPKTGEAEGELFLVAAIR